MKRNKTIYRMSLGAILIAIMLVLGFTPIGTFQLGVFTVSLLGVPVAIAACVYGPFFGAMMGLVWGVISLIQGISGIDVSGPFLLEYSP
ncbi:MAG: ECF transporter S component, partial [Bacilli bacterium]